MPQDTLWLNNESGNYIIYDHKNITDAALIRDIKNSVSTNTAADYAFSPYNNAHNDSLLQTLISYQRLHKENIFLKEKAYYDNLGDKIEFVIMLIFIAFIFYAFYRKNKKKNNPYAENDNDWIEIGTRRKNYFEEEDYTQQIKAPSYNALVYRGNDLNFSNEEIEAILNKRFPYFKNLSVAKKISIFTPS